MGEKMAESLSMTKNMHHQQYIFTCSFVCYTSDVGNIHAE